MRTVQERDAEYADQVERCEGCGRYVSEDELIEVNKILKCDDCLDCTADCTCRM